MTLIYILVATHITIFTFLLQDNGIRIIKLSQNQEHTRPQVGMSKNVDTAMLNKPVVQL